MTSEGDQMRCMKKKQEPMLFGVHLTQLYTNFSHDDHPLEASLERETRANQVPELEGSGSNSTSSTQGSKPRIFNCQYCSRKFRNFQALGGHQNAHKKERTARKSNPIPNSLPTHSFQYPAVEQQPTPAMFASNGRISHFDQLPQDFRVEFEPCSFSSLKRARSEIESASSSLPSRRMILSSSRNDPQQRKATPGGMLTLSTQDVELDFSLHL